MTWWSWSLEHVVFLTVLRMYALEIAIFHQFSSFCTNLLFCGSLNQFFDHKYPITSTLNLVWLVGEGAFFKMLVAPRGKLKSSTFFLMISQSWSFNEILKLIFICIYKKNVIRSVTVCYLREIYTVDLLGRPTICMIKIGLVWWFIKV